MIRRIGWAANRRSFVSCCGKCEGNCFNFQGVMSAHLVVKSRLLGHRDIHCPDEPNNCSARMTKAANIMPASAEKITPFHAIEQAATGLGKSGVTPAARIRSYRCGCVVQFIAITAGGKPSSYNRIKARA